ncbi:tetratricopeptide repeat protein [bacterium]|nr:tetratricopeptide repeat protein [bacterium]
MLKESVTKPTLVMFEGDFVLLFRFLPKLRNKGLIFFLLLTAGCFHCVVKNDSSLLNNYAISCIQKGLWTEASFYLERANFPESAAVCNNLGVVYEQTGRKQEAEVLYKKAIELDGQSIYYKNLSGCLEKSIQSSIAKKGVSAEKIRPEKIRIESPSPPKIDISRIDRCCLVVSGGEKQPIFSIAKQALIDATFYIVRYEGSRRDNPSEILSCSLADALLLIEVKNWNIFDIKGYELKESYNKKTGFTTWEREPYIEREARAEFLLSFFERGREEAIWKEKFSEREKKRYRGENAPDQDIELSSALLKTPLTSFLSATKPETIVIERWLARERE